MTSIPAQTASPDQLLGTLRHTPFHEWSVLRRQSSGAAASEFDSAATLVQQEWSPEERRLQLRQALTAAAASCIQAMADLDALPVTQHLAGAREALQAATQLRTGRLG